MCRFVPCLCCAVLCCAAGFGAPAAVRSPGPGLDQRNGPVRRPAGRPQHLQPQGGAGQGACARWRQFASSQLEHHVPALQCGAHQQRGHKPQTSPSPRPRPWLQPLAVEVAVAGGRICYTQLGPAAAAAGVASGTTVLQLLAIGCLLMGAGDAPGAFGFLSNALAAAWEEDPPPGVQRQLSARSWVPAFPTTTTTTSSTEGGQQQQEAPAPGLTPAGRRLAEDLQRHCPGITPADLRRWALTVRLLAGLAMGSQDPAHHKLLLASCQQVLDASDCGGAGGFHAAAWGAQVALAASSWCGLDEARAGRISAFFDAALAQAVHTRCEQGGACMFGCLLPTSACLSTWLLLRGATTLSIMPACLPAVCTAPAVAAAGYMAANQLAVQHASWLIDLRSGAAAPARQHMLAQVQQLADTGRSCLAHLKPWLAKVFLQSLKDDQQALDADVDRLLQGGAQLRGEQRGCAWDCHRALRCRGSGAALQRCQPLPAGYSLGKIVPFTIRLRPSLPPHPSLLQRRAPLGGAWLWNSTPSPGAQAAEQPPCTCASARPAQRRPIAAKTARRCTGGRGGTSRSARHWQRERGRARGRHGPERATGGAKPSTAAGGVHGRSPC